MTEARYFTSQFSESRREPFRLRLAVVMDWIAIVALDRRQG